MAKLMYAAIASLDGCVEDEEGRFDRAMPDEEVHGWSTSAICSCLTELATRRQAKTHDMVNRC